MKKLLPVILALFTSSFAFAQLTLGPSPYNQDFNPIASGLPTGFTARTGASATALGTTQAYSGTTVAWNNTSGAVKNFASATDLTSTATTAEQSSSANRSLGIRQTGAFGDPGAAFVLQLANTSDLKDFKLDFKLQSLDATSPRVTTWRVDYGFGASPTSFTAATATGTLTTGGSTFTNNTITVDFGSSLDNQADNVWIRIVAITTSTGSGNRPSSAIDDLSLTYTSGTVATPTFSVNPSAINFGNQAVGTTSAAQSHTLTYANLNGSNVVVSTAAPFTISKLAEGPFSTDLLYTSTELGATSTIVYSQFSPVTTGSAGGTITHTGGGVSGSATVLLTGTGASLTPVALNDTFSGLYGDLITGNVSSNDNDPQGLALTFSKLTDPQDGTLTFNADGTFSYQSVVGSAATQTFTYRAANTDGSAAEATVTITLAEQSKIFISQYYEGASVNKWVELTNPTSSPVNTASPQLKLGLYSISGDAGNIVISGSPAQIVNLNMIIPAKSSVLIGNTGNGNEVPYLTAASAQQTSNAVINFNGNDGIALLDAANNIIDAFGTGINAKDDSYVRSLSATTPSATFNSAEWILTPLATVQNAVDLDDPDRLGVHVQADLPECVSPVNQPTGLLFTSVGTKTITLNFTASTDAGEYLIVRSLNSTLSATPADETIYNPGSSLGGGTVAARISGSSFTDNNLASGTTFYYFIYALNNIACDGGPKYLITDPLSGTQATAPLPVCVTPVSQPTNFHISFSNYQLIQGAFTPATGVDEFLVIMSKDSAWSSLPVDQTSYVVGDSIGGGIVIKKGAQGTFNRSGLTQNTNYYFYIFSLNSNCSGGPLYLTTAPLTGKQQTGVFDNNTLNFYFGNLHAHSSYSDGNADDKTKKPEDDYAFAKNSMNMDFLGISEHNHTQAGMRLANWVPGMTAAKNATTPDFVALYGMEWGVISGGGHVLVYGVDSLIGWEPGEHQIFVPKSTYTGSTGLFNIINRHGLNAFATLAHPNFGDFNNVEANYDASADNAIVGSALESGPAFSTNTTYSNPATVLAKYYNYYNKMLAKGYHMGATIDHDNHNMTFGRHTRARLVVLAPALTENDLLDAMRKMRFYASEDSAARISYTINEQPVGSEFTGNGLARISVSGSTTSPITNITIIRGTPGSGVIPPPLVTSATSTLSYTDSTLAHLATGYYYADITEADGSRIITSPIWYTRNDSLKSEQVITFNTLPIKTYGDADFSPAATSTNASIPVTYTSSDTTVATIVSGQVHIRKAGNVNITASQAGNALFNSAVPKTQTLIIARKAVTASVDAKTKEYGAADPEWTYTVTPALVMGDTFSGSLTRELGEDAGTYVITQGTLALSNNYTLDFDSAIFTINKAAATITLSNLSQAFDGTPKGATVTTNPSGLDSVTVTYNGSSIVPSAVGTYSVAATLTNINYTAEPASATLTITQPLNLKIQYRNADGSLTNSEGKPHLKIVNTGITAVPYNQLTARYWITPENYKGSLGMWIDYAQLGNSKVIMKYVSLGNPGVNALGYIEYSFTSSAGSLAAGGNSGDIQSRYANTDWSIFNEANDHSIGMNASYADKSTITLYRNGVLVWGTEPVAEAPVVKLKVFAEAKSAGNSNSISTFVDIKNEGNVPVNYNDITARYWFTSDGTSPLKFWLDYAKIGNGAISGSFVALNPVRTDANVYLELKVKPSAITFYPLTSTGNIQYRISKSDWSNFNQLNDHSYKTGTMAENSGITIYYQGQLVYGTEPATENSAARTNTTDSPFEKNLKTQEGAEPSTTLVYPNPTSGNFTLQMNDERIGSFHVTIYNSAGKAVDIYSGEKTDGSFRKDYELKLAKGIYYMQIRWRDQSDYKKIIIN
ncbi:cellulose binding domain-containing protein [Parachryseolinea silvisoli]|uniref:cellulose binding domain-containing protein n=1 Tax=Parachryseolinea silvisoli TaxID=2873601 RepID=UPI002265893F|nr:cellulose binding domain-containing protein [Parachryseolinea silvisoli]MCD9019870.1 MBG domain-containing protein [Parachryseolinea silvisoli]